MTVGANDPVAKEIRSHVKNMNDNKSIIESMLMSGMSMEEIYNFFHEVLDIDIRDNSTTKCSECKFYKNILGIGTCGKYNEFLENNKTGCYSGEKEEIWNK